MKGVRENKGKNSTEDTEQRNGNKKRSTFFKSKRKRKRHSLAAQKMDSKRQTEVGRQVRQLSVIQARAVVSRAGGSGEKGWTVWM